MRVSVRRSPRQRHKPGAEADSRCSIASRDLGAVTLKGEVQLKMRNYRTSRTSTRSEGKGISALCHALLRGGDPNRDDALPSHG